MMGRQATRVRGMLVTTVYRVTRPLRETTRWRRWRARRFVTRLVPVAISDIRRFGRDLQVQRDFLTHVSAALDEYQRLGSRAGAMPEAELLYLVVRALRPRVVVETGVASGRSSAFILRALEDNAMGQLHSIDIPRYLGDEIPYKEFDAYLPPGKESGWVIPKVLRHRWTLHLGRSRQILPGLLATLPPLDLFLHDSEHTYDNMLWEYETAWPHLTSGDVLLSHDVLWNPAFADFCRAVDAQPEFVGNTGGVMKKHGSTLLLPRRCV